MPKSLQAKISDVIAARDALIAQIDEQIADLQARKAELLAGRDVKPKAKAKGGSGRRSKVDDATLKKMLAAGKSGKEIAEHFGVSYQTIQNRKAKLGLTKQRKAKKATKKKATKTSKKTGRRRKG